MYIWSRPSPVKMLPWIPSAWRLTAHIFPCHARPFLRGLPITHHLSKPLSVFFLSKADPSLMVSWTHQPFSNLLPYLCCSLSQEPSPSRLSAEDFSFLWGQVIVKQTPALFRTCIWNSERTPSLPFLMTWDFYFYFKCEPCCPVSCYSHATQLLSLLVIVYFLRPPLRQLLFNFLQKGALTKY